MKIGDIGSYKGILVKYVDQQGGVSFIETPHGTRIRLGWAILGHDWKPLTDGEQLQYDAWVIDAEKQRAEQLAEYRALRQTRFWKIGDHPKVWEDYISTCGGDTNNGRFYIGTTDNHMEVHVGDVIYDMPDGTYSVRKP